MENRPPMIQSMDDEFMDFCLDAMHDYITALALIPIHKTVRKLHPADEDGETVFTVENGYPYCTVTVNYSKVALNLYKKGDFSQLKQGLLHEMVHTFLQPVKHCAVSRFLTSDEWDDIYEHTTDRLTYILWGLLNK